MNAQFVELPISTRAGKFLARFSKKGLAGLDFPNEKALVVPKRSKDGPIPAEIRKWHRVTEVVLKKILAGHEPK